MVVVLLVVAAGHESRLLVVLSGDIEVPCHAVTGASRRAVTAYVTLNLHRHTVTPVTAFFAIYIDPFY